MQKPILREPEGTLLRVTLEKLKSDKRSSSEISLATGLPLAWLVSLRRGSVKNPSVNRVQKLYEQLTRKKLKLYA
jgi:hypothetical protein